MSRIRLLILSILAVLAVSAVAAAGASAASFSAGGVAAGGEIPIAPAVVVTEAPVLKATGAATITCTSITVVGGVATAGTPQAKIKALQFGKCVDSTEPTKCEVPGTIETKPLTVSLEASGTEHATIEKFQPAAGTEFTSFKIGNKGSETCETGAGKPKVVGTAKSVAEKNNTLTTRHPLSVNVTEASGELKYAEKPATLVGKGEILVTTSAKTFSLLA